MPIARSSDHQSFDLGPEYPGVTITGGAAPSRGCQETLLYRVEMAPGSRLPSHEHDHEEVFHVVAGSPTSIQDEERIQAAAGDAVMIHAGVRHHIEAGDEEAVLIVAMPVGTHMITPQGERRLPPWAQ